MLFSYLKERAYFSHNPTSIVITLTNIDCLINHILKLFFKSLFFLIKTENMAVLPAFFLIKTAPFLPVFSKVIDSETSRRLRLSFIE